MENHNLEGPQSRVKHEPPVEFVLILPRSTLGWPAIKHEKDVKPKLVPSVQLTKFDAKWKTESTLFQTFFACQHCQLVMKFRRNLTRHLRACSKINPTRFECDFCGKRFQTKGSMRQHMSKHSSERKFRCTKCDFGFTTKGQLMSHSRSKKIYKCAVCDIRFSCYPLLHRHRRDFHGNGFKCDKCSYQTKVEHSLMLHKGTHNKSISCETCQKNFSTNQLLKLHQMQHRHGIYATAPEETFDCEECDKSFLILIYLRKHQANVHNEKEFKCEVCGKIFRNRRSLLIHSQIHKKTECSVCHKKISKYKMASHLRSHSAENHFKCDLCDISTETKGNLKHHIERKHLLKKLLSDSKCRGDFCEFELLEKLQLKYGSSATSSEKKFKCDHCGKAFVTPMALSQHKRSVHTDKSFECEDCKKAFKTKGHLNRHTARVHSKKLSRDHSATNDVYT